MEACVRIIAALADLFLENQVSVLCFAAALLCLVYSWLRKRDFFNPASVYVFTQTLTLGIAYLKLDPAMTDFKWFTWMVWLGSMAAFLLGVATYRFTAGRQLEFVAPPGQPKHYNWHRHFAVSLLLFFAFLVGVAMMVYTAGGFIIFSNDIPRWTNGKAEFPPYSAELVFSASLVVMFLWAASFKSVNPHKKIRTVSRILIPVTLVIMECTFPARSHLFLSVGTMIIMYNFLGRRIPAWLILVFISLATTVFISVSTLRSQYGAQTLEGVAAEAVMSIPYKYVANNYWNLDYALNPPNDDLIHPFTYGVDAFSGMFAYVRGIPGALRDMNGWDDNWDRSIVKVGGYNTISYLWNVYKDFGVGGVVVIAFLMGLFMSWLYERTICANSIPLWILYSFFLYLLGWSFFLSPYKQGHYWLWLYFIALASVWCSGGLKARQKLPESCAAEER